MVSPTLFTYLPSNFIPSSAATTNSSLATPQNTGRPLPPGTVTYQNTKNASSPRLVQTVNGTQTVHEYNTLTDYVYNSTAGDYYFPRLIPWVLNYNYTSNEQSVSFSTFGVNQSSSFLIPASSVVSANPFSYDVNTTLMNLDLHIVGYLDQSYSFEQPAPQISVHYTQVVGGTYNIFWLIEGYPYASLTNSSDVSSDTGTLTSLGIAKSAIMSATPVVSSNYLVLNFTDYGNAEVLAGSSAFDSALHDSAQILFGQNVSTIDPTLEQYNSGKSTSSDVTVKFSNSVTKGDLLIAMVTSDSTGLTYFTLSDTQLNSWSVAELANANYGGAGRAAGIYYAIASSNGTDSVTAETNYGGYVTLIVDEVTGFRIGNIVGGIGGCSGCSAETTLSVSSFTPKTGSFVTSVFVSYLDWSSLTTGYTFQTNNGQDGYNSGSEYNTSSSNVATTTPITETESGTGYWGMASAAFAPEPVPSAGTSSSPSSKPGLSPYESYFTGESEYVSPGNGLLGIEQTDYSLAGRGLNLALTRVYSQPYAFTSSAPYMYDNYTLSNLGLGWQLNFPWMGQDYLHLSDGQVYQYNWTGSAFLNTGGTPFKLVNNSGSYDLFLASGVDYHFNSAEQLTWITDPTGNNTITFSYGSNNYISKITDTAGRNITFSYNSNKISWISTGEGDFNYTYSGDNLATVTNPAGQETKYYYSTEDNNWLVSSIEYPTGAYTNYTYSYASVGAGVDTFYVTSQNIYVSSDVLSRSTAYNYSISAAGSVQYCNSSVSNGYGKQGYIDYVFNTGNSTEVEKNAANSTILSYENVYDSLGRINESKILSPTGTVLASSITHYDNWSNVIYTKNYNGQQTWYSYANTNTTNAYEDGASGFTNSFYTNNTISSNIHDLLVGEAYWQNTIGSSNNVETYYNYNSAGELIHQKQLNSSGWQVSSYTYDNYGNQLTSTDPLGRTTYNQYSASYNHAYLTQSSIMVGGENVSTTKTYSFDTGTLSSVTDPNGETTSYQYDAIGRLTKFSYPMVNNAPAYVSYTYNDPGNYVTITDPNGDNVINHYDGLDRLTSVATYNGSSVYSTQNYTYNYLNLVASNTTAAGSVYKYTYDSMGFLTSVTNPDSTHLNYTYNYSNNTETVTDENGHETQYAYDWMHNLLWVKQWNSTSSYDQTSYSYDLTGNLLSVTDAKNQVTSYTYNDLNQLVMTKFPDGTNQTSTYDAVGNLISSTDPMGNTSSFAYNSLNELTQVSFADHSTINYTYDGDGNRLSMVDSNSSTYYSYDARDRLVNQTQIINGSGGSGGGTTFGIDGTAYSSNCNSVTTCSATLSTNSTNDVIVLTAYIASSTVHITGVSDSAGLNWIARKQLSDGFDNHDIEEWYAVASSKLSSDTISATFSSSATGGILVFGVSGANTSSPFDSYNSLPETNTYGGSGSSDPSVTVSTNNANDMLIGTMSCSGTPTISANSGFTQIGSGEKCNWNYAVPEYEIVSSKQSSTSAGFSLSASTSWEMIGDAIVKASSSSQPSSSYTTLYSYDKASNIISITYPNNFNLGYTYDPMERVASAGTIANFTYTLDNRISTISYGNGVKTTYTYNSRDMPTSITSIGGGSTLLNLNYTYDNVGNVLKLDNQNYTYNDLNELTSAQGGWGSITYSYDSVGNMVQMINGSSTTNYSYGSYSRLTSAGSNSYTYNKDGDMLTQTSSSWNYHYNYQNELTSVVSRGAIIENNTYNGDGQRLELTTNSYSLVFMSQGTNLLYEKNLSSAVVTDRFYANGMVIGEDVGQSREYYQLDALGNVRMTTYSTGTTAFSANYSPFGTVSGISGFELLQYSSKPYDSATGLYYFGARFYSPSVERFITEDTYIGSLSDPLSQNRYVYAEDNPMRYTDPTGHMMMFHNGGTTVGGGTSLLQHLENSVGGSQSSTSSPSISTTDTLKTTSPSTVTDTNTPSSSSGAGYWQWLAGQPKLWGNFLITLGGDIGALISPFLKGIFSSIMKVLVVSSAFLSDYLNSLQAIQHDPASAANLLLSFTWTLTSAIILKATGVQKFYIALGMAAAGVSDATGFGDALTAVAAFGLATDVTMFLGSSYAQWESLHSST